MNTLSLNGAWMLRWTDGQRNRMGFAAHEKTDPSRYFQATVPGEVHLDLMRQGVIADVYRDTSVLAARWVEEFIWSYRKEFEATKEMLAAAHVWLHFQQLDLVASILVNGQQVGTHRNVFYPCRVDISGKLKPGKNIITVHLDSGLYDVSDKPYAGYDNHLDGKLHKRHWLRKPQSSFSWDWSPRLINVGVTGDVRLEWTSDDVRLDTVVPLITMTDDLREGHVTARAFIEGFKEGKTASLRAEITGNGKRESVLVSDIKIRAGTHPYEAKLVVRDPKLWWPVGHGEQPMYKLKLTVEVGGKAVCQHTARIGFRHVRINQDKHPKSGRYFIIEINHKPIFCKGGNFVPADMIFSNAKRDRYEKLTDLALEANFNLLRIWGGGMYETDDFYELCDEKGILVWQEFIFACCKYPGTDEAFHEDFKREARYNIRRLAQHPSLIVWCGNNEMEEAAWYWGYDKGVVHPDYSIFHLTLPRLMAEEDPTRYYQPSSPFSPDHHSPSEYPTGDQHPWFIGFADTDFRKYRPIEPRFPNEGGCLGPTSLPTMLACVPKGQRKLHSFAWQTHENSIAIWEEPSATDRMLIQHLGKDPANMSFEEFCYWGGLVQSEGLREYCDSFRRKMFDVSSAIFWMYNDTWPAVRSWTIVDYYLRRTPAFWSVQRSMQPIHVILAEVGDKVAVFGVNETLEAVSCDLRCGVFTLAGQYSLDQRSKVVLPPNTSTQLASFPRNGWKKINESLAFAMLERDGALLAKNRLALPLMRELIWPKAQVKVKLAGGKATFNSKTFAWGVCLDLNGERALADNMFDLFPGVPHVIPWQRGTAPKILRVGNLHGTPR